jgi:hypothetical protein
MVTLASQVSPREKLHGSQTGLLFIAREPQGTFPDVGADSGMGKSQRSQNAQPDAHTNPYREHAPGPLARHGLGLLDDHMALGATVGREEGHEARDVVFLPCATTGAQGKRRHVMHAYEGTVSVQDAHSALKTTINTDIHH